MVITGIDIAFSALVLGAGVLWRRHRVAEKRIIEGDAQGQWVAEAWLEWPICSGSTLYRAAFNDEEEARAAAKNRAAYLDKVLPAYYTIEVAGGGVMREAYGYGIHWAVRERSLEEQQGLVKVWSPHLPGLRQSA